METLTLILGLIGASINLITKGVELCRAIAQKDVGRN
jgi:hypothetical protein